MSAQWLISVDPGVRGLGLALWVHGLLVRAEYVATSDGHLGEVARAAQSAVRQWLQGCKVYGALEAFIEVPQTYRGRAARGDANDLISVAVVAGAVCLVADSTVFVHPHQWKGSIPKRNEHGVNVVRERCLGELSPRELAAVALPPQKSLQHNVWDAVGIGLWRIKGLRPL